ncbi:MAG: hypothetical protein AAB521_01535 [Patescibacteria group bacterium]
MIKENSIASLTGQAESHRILSQVSSMKKGEESAEFRNRRNTAYEKILEGTASLLIARKGIDGEAILVEIANAMFPKFGDTTGVNSTFYLNVAIKIAEIAGQEPSGKSST